MEYTYEVGEFISILDTSKLKNGEFLKKNDKYKIIAACKESERLIVENDIKECVAIYHNEHKYVEKVFESIVVDDVEFNIGDKVIYLNINNTTSTGVITESIKHHEEHHFKSWSENDWNIAIAQSDGYIDYAPKSNILYKYKHNLSIGSEVFYMNQSGVIKSITTKHTDSGWEVTYDVEFPEQGIYPINEQLLDITYDRQGNRLLIYIAGDLMSEASQMKRDKEKQIIVDNNLGDVYVPHENKSINDKQNASQEDLAERIVREDMIRIDACDVMTIEPQSYAQGTLVELGIVYGMKHVAKQINDILENPDVNTLDAIEELANRITNKKVYPHLSDIRRTNIPEVGDRRSFSINQFVYGVMLALSNGKGVYEWDEIIEGLKEDGKNLNGGK